MHNIPFNVLTIENDGHHIVIDVEIFDKKFKMVIDTGASKTVLDRDSLFEIGITDNDLISTSILSTGLGTNEMKSQILCLDTFKINTWKIRKVQVAVLDLSTINYAYRQMDFDPVIGVLGGDILTAYRAVINYKKKTLCLNSRKQKSTM